MVLFKADACRALAPPSRGKSRELGTIRCTEYQIRHTRAYMPKGRSRDGEGANSHSIMRCVDQDKAPKSNSDIPECHMTALTRQLEGRDIADIRLEKSQMPVRIFVAHARPPISISRLNPNKKRSSSYGE